MLRKLREEGPTKVEANLLNGVLEKLDASEVGPKKRKAKNASAPHVAPKAVEPNVMVLKRKR
jgi:hypothetical protein